MALTKTVTKLRPNLDNRNIATIGLHLKIEDDGNTVIDTDVTETYAKNQLIEPIKAELQKKAQALIDKYLEEKELYGKQVYTNAIAEIDSSLDITET